MRSTESDIKLQNILIFSTHIPSKHGMFWVWPSLSHQKHASWLGSGSVCTCSVPFISWYVCIVVSCPYKCSQCLHSPTPPDTWWRPNAISIFRLCILANTRCWNNARPASQMASQHHTNIDSIQRLSWDLEWWYSRFHCWCIACDVCPALKQYCCLLG